MLRHACVVTLVLLVTLNFGGVTLEEAEASEHGWHYRQKLNEWDYSVFYDQWDSFRLQAEPEFDRYFYAVETYDQTPITEQGVGVAIIEVTQQSTNILVCRGIIWSNPVIDKLQYCDDMRAGHHYKIEYQLLVPGTHIALYGVDPIAPIQHGDPPL